MRRVRTPPMRSASIPKPIRLTNPAMKRTESTHAPCSRVYPRSVAWLTRCTIGIDIAAQQKTPPNHRIPCTARGESSSPRPSSTRTPNAPPAAVIGGRGRSRRARGTIDAAANALK